MKNKFVVGYFFLCICNSNSIASEPQIFKSLTIENDIVKDGVRGLNVISRFNFLPLEELNKNDTVLTNAEFQFKTSFTENGIPVKVAKGYQSVADADSNAEFSSFLSSSDITASNLDRRLIQFIPYASLNLKEGQHSIIVKTQLIGKDGANVSHKNILEKSAESFVKPAAKLFTMNIDYIEVNTMNSSGQAWDYSFFNTDAPDVGVNILMGNTSVFKSNVNDTYMFAVGPNSKNISFIISENDKVTILVQDIDVMFHDYISKWNFTTDDKKLGTVYTYNKSKGNI